MADYNDISPERRELMDAMQEAVERLLHARAAGDVTESILYTGAWQDVSPRALLISPELQPIDKLVWQIIKIHADPSMPAAMPSTENIARLSVVSPPTVSRSLFVLRATRWLSVLAQRARDRQTGRVIGNIYLLHDAPLSIAEVMQLDEHYLKDLGAWAKHHRHDFVQKTAAAQLGLIDHQIERGEDITAPTSSLERLLGRTTSTASNYSFMHKHSRDTKPSEPHKESLGSPPEISSRGLPKDSLCGLPKEFLHGSICSSSNKNITTTTTKNVDNSSSESAKPDSSLLVYPDFLTENERMLLARYLSTVPEGDAQEILYEAWGRIEKKRPQNRIGYIVSMIQRWRDDKFCFTNVGLTVREKHMKSVSGASSGASSGAPSTQEPSGDRQDNEVWKDVMEQLAAECDPRDYNQWLRPLRPHLKRTGILVYAPNTFVIDYVSDHYLERIKELLEPRGINSVRLVIGDGA